MQGPGPELEAVLRLPSIAARPVRRTANTLPVHAVIRPAPPVPDVIPRRRSVLSLMNSARRRAECQRVAIGRRPDEPQVKGTWDRGAQARDNDSIVGTQNEPCCTMTKRVVAVVVSGIMFGVSGLAAAQGMADRERAQEELECGVVSPRSQLHTCLHCACTTGASMAIRASRARVPCARRSPTPAERPDSE